MGSEGGGVGVGGGLDGVEEGEEDAAEGGFAAGGVVPLLEGVDAAACASGADGDGGDSEGEGDVGVGGAEAGFGAEGEVAVDGAEGVEEGGVVGEGGGGAVSDGFDVEFGWWALVVLCVVAVATISSRIWWTSVAVATSWAGSVERRSRRAVADSGMELTEVPPEMWPTLMVVRGLEGSLRCGDGRVRALAEEEDGVGGAGVGPGVAAGAGDGDAEAEAAEGAGDDGGAAAAFEGDGGGDAVAIGAAVEEVTHAAEVAFAFFAYVGGEEDGDGWCDVGVAECGGDGEEGGEAGGVVADAGSVDAGGVVVFDGFEGVPAGKTVSRWAERRMQGVGGRE